MKKNMINYFLILKSKANNFKLFKQIDIKVLTVYIFIYSVLQVCQNTIFFEILQTQRNIYLMVFSFQR